MCRCHAYECNAFEMALKGCDRKNAKDLHMQMAPRVADVAHAEAASCADGTACGNGRTPALVNQRRVLGSPPGGCVPSRGGPHQPWVVGVRLPIVGRRGLVGVEHWDFLREQASHAERALCGLGRRRELVATCWVGLTTRFLVEVIVFRSLSLSLWSLTVGCSRFSRWRRDGRHCNLQQQR